MATILENMKKTGKLWANFTAFSFLSNYSMAFFAEALTYITRGNWGQHKGYTGKLFMFSEENHQILEKNK